MQKQGNRIRAKSFCTQGLDLCGEKGNPMTLFQARELGEVGGPQEGRELGSRKQGQLRVPVRQAVILCFQVCDFYTMFKRSKGIPLRRPKAKSSSCPLPLERERRVWLWKCLKHADLVLLAGSQGLWVGRGLERALWYGSQRGLD